MYHTPVLLEPTLNLLALKLGAMVIDATLGDGGHSEAMLEKIGSTGRILGFDASPSSLSRARVRLEKFADQVSFVHSNFGDMKSVAVENGFTSADAVLMDLGLASWQLDQPELGLSFQRSEPLDMRLDPRNEKTAASIVNRASEAELTDIFERYGDLHRGRPLAQRIVDARRKNPIKTTTDLVDLVGSHSPQVLAPIFQALRIAVNDELGILESSLHQALDLLVVGGRIVVISYHSGEDRIVKNVFRQCKADGGFNLLTPKPIVPDQDEQRRNPRSRSAKLRAIQKV